MRIFPIIDYTKKRLGTRIRRASRIEKCPACGRKGEMSRSTYPNGRPYWSCTHTAEDWGWATFQQDNCHGYVMDGIDTVSTPAKEA